MENNQFDLGQGRFIPVHCPHCKSKNIKFLPEYHKCLLLRILTTLLFSMACFFFFYGMAEALSLPNKDNNASSWYTIGAIFGVFAFILYSIRIVRESKTHVQCVCPDCGYVWIHQ